MTESPLSRLSLKTGKPLVSRGEFPLKLSGTPRSWAKSLADLGFSKVDAGSTLELVQSLSQDSRGHDFEHITLRLSKSALALEYTYWEGAAAAAQIRAARLVLLTLSALKALRLPAELSGFIASALESSDTYAHSDLQVLLSKNARLEAELSLANKKLSELYRQREELAKTSMADAQRISSLESRLGALMEVPDSALDEMVLSHLGATDGKIRVVEFSRSVGVSAARVSQSLDRLAKLSRIKRLRDD